MLLCNFYVTFNLKEKEMKLTLRDIPVDTFELIDAVVLASLFDMYDMLKLDSNSNPEDIKALERVCRIYVYSSNERLKAFGENCE
jgi:predicted RNA-binding protein (virulence factor B family)